MQKIAIDETKKYTTCISRLYVYRLFSSIRKGPFCEPFTFLENHIEETGSKSNCARTPGPVFFCFGEFIFQSLISCEISKVTALLFFCFEKQKSVKQKAPRLPLPLRPRMHLVFFFFAKEPFFLYFDLPCLMQRRRTCLSVPLPVQGTPFREERRCIS